MLAGPEYDIYYNDELFISTATREDGVYTIFLFNTGTKLKRFLFLIC
jgi:hypothetical protein